MQTRCTYFRTTWEGGLDIIQYFERNYKSLLLCAVMMIKDVDKAQDILHSVAVGLLTRKDELSELRHPSAFIAQCIYRGDAELFAQGSQVGGL